VLLNLKVDIMKKITTILAMLLFAASQGAFAQLTIFGSVVDAKDGSGIPGAYVIVKDTNIGGTTNSSGNFGIMNVPNDAILQVSFTGYKTVEIPVENQTRFEITLEQDVLALEEVVVTAPARVAPPQTVEIMGMVRNINTLPFATIVISEDEFAIWGWGALLKVPGYFNGRFRGPTSWSSGTDTRPLYVLDGVPIGKSRPDWLDPFMIESITVIRSAAVFYGSEAANGVIIITTKK